MTKSTISIAALLLLSACAESHVKDTLGLRRSGPDAFKVVSNAPLSMPPSYSLTPPKPGQPRPQEQNIEESSRDLLFESDGSTGSTAEEASYGERNLLAKAGTTEADPQIKEKLDLETYRIQRREEEKGVLGKIVDYTRNPTKDEDPVVNASKEQERIQQNKSEGKAINEGEVPTNKKTDYGLFSRLFGGKDKE